MMGLKSIGFEFARSTQNPFVSTTEKVPELPRMPAAIMEDRAVALTMLRLLQEWAADWMRRKAAAAFMQKFCDLFSEEKGYEKMKRVIGSSYAMTRVPVPDSVCYSTPWRLCLARCPLHAASVWEAKTAFSRGHIVIEYKGTKSDDRSLNVIKTRVPAKTILVGYYKNDVILSHLEAIWKSKGLCSEELVEIGMTIGWTVSRAARISATSRFAMGEIHLLQSWKRHRSPLSVG